MFRRRAVCRGSSASRMKLLPKARRPATPPRPIRRWSPDCKLTGLISQVLSRSLESLAFSLCRAISTTRVTLAPIVARWRTPTECMQEQASSLTKLDRLSKRQPTFSQRHKKVMVSFHTDSSLESATDLKGGSTDKRKHNQNGANLSLLTRPRDG